MAKWGGAERKKSSQIATKPEKINLWKILYIKVKKDHVLNGNYEIQKKTDQTKTPLQNLVSFSNDSD